MEQKYNKKYKYPNKQPFFFDINPTLNYTKTSTSFDALGEGRMTRTKF